MKPTITAIEHDLRALLKGDVEFDAITRHLYATDGGLCQIEPLGVVCSPRHRGRGASWWPTRPPIGLPLVPRGAGSGLAGAAVGAGLQVDFTRYMNRDPGGGPRRLLGPGPARPGHGRAERRSSSRTARFFAPNPSSENYCSLGGMIAQQLLGLPLGGVRGDQRPRPGPGGGAERRRGLPRGDGGARGSGAPPPAGRRTRRPGAPSRPFCPCSRRRPTAIDAAMPRVMKNCSGYRVETVLDDGPRPTCTRSSWAPRARWA